MQRWVKRSKRHGFTIVEIAIVITVIGILAAISVVAYNGFQPRAAGAAMINDLQHAATSLEASYLTNKTYPTTLPTDVVPSPNVMLTVSTVGIYQNLSQSQNALLLYDICHQMLTEGKGRGVNDGGTTEDYITDCIVYNSNEFFHINGWATVIGTAKFDVPISSTALNDKADSITYENEYRDAGPISKNFFRELHQRFVSQGGYYPVDIFWDSDNSPIAKPTLPVAFPGGGWLTANDYCVQARHSKFLSLTWYIKPDSRSTIGTC